MSDSIERLRYELISTAETSGVEEMSAEFGGLENKLDALISLQKTQVGLMAEGTTVHHEVAEATAQHRLSITDLVQGYQQLKEFAGQAYEFLQEAAARANMVESFERLARTAGVSGAAVRTAMEEAADGTVSLQAQIAAANRLLGASFEVSAQDIGDALAIARQKAREFGLTTEEAFNRLIEGATKGSVEMLDELNIIVRTGEATQRYADAVGKSVDELTAAERQGAIFRQILEDNADAIERNADGSETMADGIARADVAFDNLKGTIQEIIANSPLIVDVFNFLADRFNDIGNILSGSVAGWEGMIATADVLQRTGDNALAAVAGMDALEDAARRAAVAAGDMDALGLGEDFLQLGRDLTYSRISAEEFTTRWQSLREQVSDPDQARALDVFFYSFENGLTPTRAVSEVLEELVFQLGPMATAQEAATQQQAEWVEITQEATAAAEEQSTAIDKLAESLEGDIAKAYQQRAADAVKYRAEQEKAALELENKLAAIVRDGEQKQSDIRQDGADKLEDVTNDIGDKEVDLANNIADSRYDIEKEYQDRVRALRLEGSDDINEAIRNRDARALDKARKDRDDEVRDIEQDRVDDLRDLEQNRQRKEREIDLSEQRVTRDQRIAQDRRLRDQQTAEQRSMQLTISAATTERQMRLQAWSEETTAYQTHLDQMLAMQRRYVDASTALSQNAINIQRRLQSGLSAPQYNFEYTNPETNVSKGRLRTGVGGGSVR